jgi:eukaryotic-like serine/threonine-protein kinase
MTSRSLTLAETVRDAGMQPCPGLATLLALVAGPSDVASLEHLDTCGACRDRVRTTRRAATELGDDGHDVGCDAVEALVAELDDGGALTLGEEARVLVHFVSCEPCRLAADVLDTAAPLRGFAPTSPLPVVPRSSYRFEGEIARGGMGRILRAVDLRLGRPVAVKEVLPESGRTFAEVQHWNARLEREAHITARLNHPAIVSVHEAGVWPNGTPFIAMDLVAGRSLDRVIAGAQTLEARLALLPHAIAVADALAYAHSEGIVHRDLKPANVLVGGFGETVVIDWGLAKAAGTTPAVADAPSIGRRAQDGLTADGATVGTPAYMPPEQAAGGAVDRRADVYALGALLYHLLTGRPPYAGTTRDLLDAVQDHPPRAVTEVEPRVPASLATIVGKAMSRRAADRFPSAGELADDLRRFQTGQLVRAHRYAVLDRVRHWLTHRRVSVTLAVSLTAALVVTGAVGVARVLHERDRVAAAATRVERFNERLIVERARAMVARDPTAAVAWLRRLTVSEHTWLDAHAVAEEAEASGVARRVLASHTAAVTFVTTSADGGIAVSGASDGELRVWDLVAGTVRRLGAHGGTVHELALASDHRTVAVAGEAGLELWDLASGTPRRLRGHRGAVYTVGFTAGDRSIVSGGADGTVRRSSPDAAEHRLLLGTDDPTAPLPPRLHTIRTTQPDTRHVLTYHAPGRDLTVVLTAAGGVVALDAEGRARWQREHPAGMPPYAALSPRGDELATVGQDGELRRFELDTGTWRPLGHAPDVVRVEYSPDGRWLAASSRETAVKLWDLRDHRERVFEGNTLSTYRVVFSRDAALLASAGHDGTVRIWDPDQGEVWTLRGHRASVQWVAWGKDRSLLSMSLDGTARLWQPTRRATRALTGHDGPVYGVRFAAGGAIAATHGLDGRLRIWDVASLTSRELSHPEGVWRAWLSADAARAVTSDAATVCRLWDVAAATHVVIGGPGTCREDARFDPTGGWLATLDRGGALRVYPADEPAVPVVEQDDVLAMTFAPGGSDLLYLTTAGAIVRRAAAAWASPGAVVGHTPRPRRAAWSADGGTVAVDDGHRVTVVDVAKRRSTAMARPDVAFYDLVLTADGRRLAIGDLRGGVNVYDTTTGAREVLAGHTQGVTVLALAGTRRWAASASQGELLLRDLDTGHHRRLHGHSEWVNDLAFSPDGDRLLSGGTDGSVRLWSAELASTPPASPAAVAAALDRATTATLDDDGELVVER